MGPTFVELVILLVILIVIFGFRFFPRAGEWLGRSWYTLRHRSQTNSGEKPDDWPPRP
jgi:Sec-independent protein translocase protein TatA